jgi:hypothetical protein
MVRELEGGVSRTKIVMAVFCEHAEKLKVRTEFSQRLIYCAISYILRKRLSSKEPHNVT